MALESPLVSSPANNMQSAFSPYTEFSLSPNSPAMPTPAKFQSLSARSSTESSNLRPESADGPISSSMHLPSPSDMVGPSPVTSNGTATTDIEDDPSEEIETRFEPAKKEEPPLKMLNTNMSARFRKQADDEPPSVIHAPQGYMSFNNTKNPNPPQEPPPIERSTPKPYQAARHVPESLNFGLRPGDKTITSSPVSPPPISTDVPPAGYSKETVTPRAQTRQELETMSEGSRIRSSSASSLEGIPEDYRESEDNIEFSSEYQSTSSEHEIASLKTALHECWTLCNTLASLSSIHRDRIFSHSGTGETHEKAWKCCWRLCQELYDSRDDAQIIHVAPTLDLCREFCQSLFDVRQRGNEVSDSVLRVSFELNNHLFNTHDRSLPEAFRERTLDFYITLCHRLMKQRSELAEETDSLLRCCWGLAEMLFSLRQNARDLKAPDEELLGSAVQACWELCDLFREGWTQVRPERGTPRPSQTTFSHAFDSLSRSSSLAPSSSISSLPSLIERAEPRALMPETPTTEFEDTPISPEDHSPSIPNILVLGTEGRSSTRWSSNSSNLSGYSQGSNKTSSTIKTATGPEDVNLTRLKILILKAAMNVGFDRQGRPGSSNSSNAGNGNVSSSANAHANALQSWVKTLPTGSFGSLPWHTALLSNYKDLVLSDPTFRTAVTLPAPGKRANALDMAKSVMWMMRSPQYAWLKDLYRLVFGFNVEDAEKRKNVGVVV